jgi:hypothetical protein
MRKAQQGEDFGGEFEGRVTSEGNGEAGLGPKGDPGPQGSRVASLRRLGLRYSR